MGIDVPHPHRPPGERTGHRFRVRVHGRDGTRTVASSVAGRLLEGDAVLLTGGLASGKTTFVTAVAAALGSPDAVTSPTFTLANFYASPAGPLLHIDTYRLADVAEFRDLGLDDYTDESIVLVEWGGLVAHEFACPLTVDLTVPDDRPDEREITVSATAPRWTDVLPALESEILERPARC